MKEDAPTVSSPSSSIDPRTVFVRRISEEVDEAMLTEAFSAVGPVRRAFLIRDTNSKKHKRYGFVQYALQEDAERAIAEMNGMELGSKHLAVEGALKRAPMENRKRKQRASGSSEGACDDGIETIANIPKAARIERPETSGLGPTAAEEDGGTEAIQAPRASEKHQSSSKRGPDRKHASEKHALVRTIALGGLTLKDIETSIAMAKTAGSVEKTTMMSADECQEKYGQYKLRQDGCYGSVVFVRYSSVKEAMNAVATLHGKSLSEPKSGKGPSRQSRPQSPKTVLWARQVSGEGMHMKKWRVIVRNVSFKATENDIRQAFSEAGFVWDLTRPLGPDGVPKGFAFLNFCCRADAERAVKIINGSKLLGRTIAVDWAVSKRAFETAMDHGTSDVEEEIAGGDSDSEDDGRRDASGRDFSTKETRVLPKGFGHEDDEEEEEEEEEGKGNGGEEDTSDQQRQQIVTARERKILQSVIDGILGHDRDIQIGDENKMRRFKELDDDDDGGKALKRGKGDREASSESSDSSESADESSVDINEESDVTNDSGEISESNESSRDSEGQGDDIKDHHTSPLKDILSGKRDGTSESDAVKRVEERVAQLTQAGIGIAGRKDSSSSMDRTVFVRGLPLDITKEQLHQALTEFGPIRSCRLVLQKSTRIPKGTAFVEFRLQEGAKSVVEACRRGRERNGPGIVVCGRQIDVDTALDSEGARALAADKGKEKSADKRNLYLAKEGRIVEGSAAWEEMSISDRNKRLRAAKEAKMKLKSPNYHVSSTRLNVRNVPRAWDEKKLKQLFVEAVTRRAVLARPKVKQVKILREGGQKSGKSKGIAFVDFTETEHSICALRELNNNPNIWGSDQRPIIEFAIDDIKILKKREARNAMAQRRQQTGEHDHGDKDAKNTSKSLSDASIKKTKNHVAGNDDSEIVENSNAKEDGDKPKSKRKKRQERRLMLKRLQRQQQGKHDPEDLASKQQDTQGKSARRREQRKRKKENATQGGGEGSTSAPTTSRGRDDSATKNRDSPTGSSVLAEDPKPSKKRKSPANGISQERKAGRKRRMDALVDGLASVPKDGVSIEKERPKRRVKTRDKDRVDVLIDEYTSKNFSEGAIRSSQKKTSAAKKKNKRWFE